MNAIIKNFTVVVLMFLLLACQETIPTISELRVPSNLDVNVVVSEDKSGNITLTPTADNAKIFHIYFTPNVLRDEDIVLAGQKAKFRYTENGKYNKNITVVAFSNGGISTSKIITVSLEVVLRIDAETLKKIAGDGEKKWVWDKTEGGHFGVGPPSSATPEWFSASPNQINTCMYDDVLTFSYDGDNYKYKLSLGADNNTFVNWREINTFFPSENGKENEDECRDVTGSGKLSLDTSFTIITNESTKSQKLQLVNSALSYWAGVKEYDILELTASKLKLSGLQTAPDGTKLRWYHTFIPQQSTSTPTTKVGTKPYDELVWSDEFNTAGAPDPTKWGYDIGTGSNGWGNQEEQYYTKRSDNVIIEDGKLKIIAKKENHLGSNYTSARLLTKGKYNFQYGKIEVRAKLPSGFGTWPAIWMLGKNIDTAGWPACGEIDIMEHVGKEQNKILGTTHDSQNSGANGRSVSTTKAGVSTDFHTYTAEWDETSIKFSMDGIEYGSVSNEASRPFNQGFFIILNVAMGGTLGGTIASSFTSSTMEIDYIRVYQ